MNELPLFEEIIADIEAGVDTLPTLIAFLDELEARCSSYQGKADEALATCRLCADQLRHDPSAGRARELDVACRFLARSLLRGEGSSLAWPSLPHLLESLNECQPRELELEVSMLLERELRSVKRACAQPAQVEAWKQGLLNLAQIFENLLAGKYTPPEGARHLKVLLERLERLWQDEIAAGYSSSPTQWPAVNAVIQVGRALQKRQAMASHLEAVINGLLDSVDELEQSTQELVTTQEQEGTQGSALSAEIARRLRQQLHALNQASLRVLLHLEQGKSLEPIWASYEATGEAAAAAIQEFLRANDDVGKIPCIRCGAPNPSDRSHCIRCQAILPRALETREAYSVAEGAEIGGPQIGEHLGPLLAAIDEALASPDALYQVESLLDAFEQRFERALQNRSKLPSGTAEAESYAEILELTEEGIDSIREGTREGLECGRQLLLDANERSQALTGL